MVWIVMAAAVAALLFFFIAKKRTSQETELDYPFKKLPVLFTPAERSFFGVLDQAVGKDFRLFGKVRVADVLTPREGIRKSVWQTAFNKINRKHFDFVLCDPDNLSVLCAIELDDKSHQQKHRQDRDDFLVKACLAAHLPLVQFQAQHAYSAIDVSAKIADVISGTSTRTATPDAAPSATRKERSQTTEEIAAPTCPRCSSAMVKRTAKGGENMGQEFWGCSNFPKCRGVVVI